MFKSINDAINEIRCFSYLFFVIRLNSVVELYLLKTAITEGRKDMAAN